MKNFLKLLFFFLAFNGKAQQAYQLLEIPKLNTGILGDELVRTISAGENGATFRFVDPSLGKALWHSDSLLNFLIVHYDLDSSATAQAMAFSVGDFIKKGGLEDRIVGFGSQAIIIDRDSTQINLYTNLDVAFNTPSAQSSDFSLHFCQLMKGLAARLGKEVKTSVLSINSHVVAEYYDKGLNKWVYVDVDPQSKIFIPTINKLPLSIEEWLVQPKLILQDEAYLAKPYENAIDSILVEDYYRNMVERLLEAKHFDRKECETGDIAFDYYIRLAPEQSLSWSYTVDALRINANVCDDMFLKAYETVPSRDSALIVDAFIAYSQCLKQDSMYVVPRILGGVPLFGDSTYFGKNNLRENTFKTSLPKGVYDANQVFIPHFIKKLSGEIIIKDQALSNNFEVELYNFDKETNETNRYVFKDNLYQFKDEFSVLSEDAEIIFYSNDAINFEVDVPFTIAVLEGSIVVEHFKNDKSIALVKSE